MSHTLPPIQPAKYDNLFKDIITAEWGVKSDGHVEAPQGYFAVVEIPSLPGELQEMKDAVESDLDSSYPEWPDSGWYFCVINNDGLIFVYKTGKSAAEMLYEDRLKEFTAWDAD